MMSFTAVGGDLDDTPHVEPVRGNLACELEWWSRGPRSQRIGIVIKMTIHPQAIGARLKQSTGVTCCVCLTKISHNT